MSNAPAITFKASVHRVRTLPDHGIMVELELPEDAIPAMAQLAEARRQGIYLQVSCEAAVGTDTKPEPERRKPKF